MEGEIENSFLKVREKANWSSNPNEEAIMEIEISVVIKRLRAFFNFSCIIYCFGDK